MCWDSITSRLAPDWQREVKIINMKKSVFLFALLAGLVSCGGLLAQSPGIKNVLLIHGAFADGSGWQGVYKILSAKGYTVTVVQNPLSSMDEDVASVRRAMDRMTGPCILVGHSYGGAIITEAGSDERVRGLVYVDAFQPDSAESIVNLVTGVPDLTNGGILPPDASGLIYFDKAKYHAGFCADLSAGEAEFMYASQIPVAASGFVRPMSHAPWRTKPCWGIVGTEDKSINPVLLRRLYQRSNTKTTEIKGASHVVFVSHPKEVADVIEAAAKSSN
jgi:pimeloyl-ACP methyl ester carboxylesterase